MSIATSTTAVSKEVFEAYLDNLPRHLLGVSTYLQTRMMHILAQDYGHQNLRLSFAPYITLAGEGDLRVSQAASLLGISRQACNQAAQLVEKAGYLERLDDPSDGRAKIMRLTAAGRALRRDGVQAVASLEKAFSDSVGADALSEARRTLLKLYAALNLSAAPDQVTGQDTPMGALLPRLADYILLRLMRLTQDKGHTGLKISFGQVLPFIGTEGGRIQEIAKLHDVSKQAISAIAGELESLGYLCREPHPADARQLLLQFSARGETLIADSVDSTLTLEQEFTAIVGKRAMTHTARVLRELYLTFQPEHSALLSVGHSALRSAGYATRGKQATATADDTTDLRLLATQLQQQLGRARCRELAALLTDNTRKRATARGQSQ